MTSYLYAGALVGLLMACLIFATYEIYNDFALLGLHAGRRSRLAVLPLAPRGPCLLLLPAAGRLHQTGVNTGYLVFFSEISPKTEPPTGSDGVLLCDNLELTVRPAMYYEKEHFIEKALLTGNQRVSSARRDQVHRQGVAWALDELFSSTQVARERSMTPLHLY